VSLWGFHHNHDETHGQLHSKNKG